MVLITLLIGAIIAQQGFFHFRQSDADAYGVDMVGILVLRELAPSHQREEKFIWRESRKPTSCPATHAMARKQRE
jgi:Permease MlaE